MKFIISLQKHSSLRKACRSTITHPWQGAWGGMIFSWEKNNEVIKSAEHFSQLCTMERSDEIATHALINTLTENKRNIVIDHRRHLVVNANVVIATSPRRHLHRLSRVIIVTVRDELQRWMKHCQSSATLKCGCHTQQVPHRSISCHCTDLDSIKQLWWGCWCRTKWRDLAELTLADIITFNRRRQGEV